VNFKSNPCAARTLMVGYCFRPWYLWTTSLGAFTCQCEPSIAPTQS